MSNAKPPRLGIMSTKYFKGLQDLGDEGVRPLLIMPWDSAWEEEFATDAHLVTYYPVGTGQSRWPRYSKVAYGQLRNTVEEADLLTQCMILDYDRPEHAPWGSLEEIGDWLEQLAATADEEPLAWAWNVLYTTKSGARLVYLLEEPVPVQEGEAHHRWLCQRLREVGILIDNVDAAGLSDGREVKVRFPTSDWTRCFRLPKVLRDGKRTAEADYYLLETQPDQRVGLDQLGKIDRRLSGTKAAIERLDLPKPTVEEAEALLHEVNPKSGRRQQSPAFKEARRRLKGRDSYDCLFDHAPIAQEGHRDSTIMSYTAQVVAILHGVTFEEEPLCSPEFVYALFLGAVLQLEGDKDNPDWTNKLWYHVLRAWEKEEAEAKHQAVLQEREALDAAETLEQIILGMQAWCRSPKLKDPVESVDFALAHLIATNGRTCYVMRPDGYYDPMAVSLNTLPSRIRTIGMDKVIQTKIPTKDGGYRFATPQDLISEYSTLFAHVQGVATRDGAIIREIDSHRARIVVPVYALRSDLPALYDADVDAWLKAFFNVHFEQGMQWLAWALQIHSGPICALSIQGQAGAGKGMLVAGLAECFTNQTIATGDDLLGQYQPGLLNSPVLHVDEGWPLTRGHRHPADIFREIVGGGRRFVNRKYMAPTEIMAPTRVILTANNPSLVQGLCTGRDMSPEDREALAVRLLHLVIGDKGAHHLRRKGGERHTAGWVTTPNGEKGHERLAKHLFWISENYKGARGKRLLVHGNGHSSLMDHFRTQSGSAPVVIECLLQMLESRVAQEGMVIEDDRIYVLTSSVLQYWRKELAGTTSEKLTANKIATVFKGLVTSTPVQKVLKKRPNLGRKRWHEMDAALLQSVARNTGWGSDKLDKIVAAQREAGSLPERKRSYD